MSADTASPLLGEQADSDIGKAISTENNADEFFKDARILLV